MTVVVLGFSLGPGSMNVIIYGEGLQNGQQLTGAFLFFFLKFSNIYTSGLLLRVVNKTYSVHTCSFVFI